LRRNSPDDDLLERLTAPLRAVKRPPGAGTIGADFSRALVSLEEVRRGRKGREREEGEGGRGRKGRGSWDIVEKEIGRR
jgi:hypothetical protein